LPENLGLKIDNQDGQLIQTVDPGSAAALAGLKPGDRIVMINGQAIISIADMQWVFHNLSNNGESIRFSVQRNGEFKTVNLNAPKNWKKTDFSWRGSMWNMKPKMGIWMPFAEERELKRLGLPEGQKAMQVKWINHQTPTGRAARNAGLREGDFIISIEGKPIQMDHRQLNYHVKLNYKPGDKLPMILWRNGNKITFNCPLE
jgi:serine protease Do